MSLRHIALAACMAVLACVRIESPDAAAPTLATDESVALAFLPPLGEDERVEVRLRAGLDTNETPELRDLSGDLVTSEDGAAGALTVGELPPGRSELVIERFPAGWTRGSGPVRRTLDRGGFGRAGRNAVGLRRDATTRISEAGFGPREIQLWVWYPTDAGPPGAAGGTSAIEDAPRAAGARALPAVLFSHGHCGGPDQSSYLTLGLARAGYVVVAPAHPGDTAADASCDDAQQRLVSFAERPGDVVATLDWLLESNADPGSPLHDLVDPGRLALAGWSFGGQTVVRTLPLEPRFRAGLALAPSYAPVAFFIDPTLPLDVPTMIQGATLDDTAPFAVDQVPLYEKLAAPRYLVEITDTGHFAFGDAACLACGPDIRPQDDAHALILRYALGFLGLHVAGDRRWAVLLSPGRGVRWWADPLQALPATFERCSTCPSSR